MSTGRTLDRWHRNYVDGCDLSGDVRKFSEMGVDIAQADVTAALLDEIKNSLDNQPNAKLGAINVLFNNAADGAHTIANGWAGSAHQVMIPIGTRAAPAAGDKAFAGAFELDDYKTSIDNGVVVATFKWGAWDAAQLINYFNLFGVLLHAKSVETGVNSAIGIDDNGGASAFGGWMAFHLFSSNGTVTLNVQDAATNLDGSFADLSGATSGSLNASVTPVSGIVALAKTATVRQYLRPQIALGTATTCTYALSFHRAIF